MSIGRHVLTSVLAFTFVRCGSTHFTDGNAARNAPVPGTEDASASNTSGTGEDESSEVTPEISSESPPGNAYPNVANANPEKNPSTAPVKPTPTIVPDPANPSGAGFSLNWYWSCDTQNAPPPSPSSPTEILISGSGAHVVPKAKISGAPMFLTGKTCPVTVPRDIVFVVDVSNSMEFDYAPFSASDPLDKKNNTCGRLEAVKTVMNNMSTLTQGDAKFAVVTFAHDAINSSGGFYSTLDAMFSQKLFKVLCDHDYGTNYSAGLAEAQALFAKGRGNATREVYFISDGQPTNPISGADAPNDPTYNGTTQAAALKASGATIATFLLGNVAGGDQVMINNIASVDDKGAPIHSRVADANNLADVMNRIANSNLISGTFSYRPIGATSWTTLDITKYQKGSDFVFPQLTFDAVTSPLGVEVQYLYRDKAGATHQGSGSFTWQ